VQCPISTSVQYGLQPAQDYPRRRDARKRRVRRVARPDTPASGQSEAAPPGRRGDGGRTPPRAPAGAGKPTADPPSRTAGAGGCPRGGCCRPPNDRRHGGQDRRGEAGRGGRTPGDRRGRARRLRRPHRLALVLLLVGAAGAVAGRHVGGGRGPQGDRRHPGRVLRRWAPSRAPRGPARPRLTPARRAAGRPAHARRPGPYNPRRRGSRPERRFPFRPRSSPPGCRRETSGGRMVGPRMGRSRAAGPAPRRRNTCEPTCARTHIG
jgi:hypothetical protein